MAPSLVDSISNKEQPKSHSVVPLIDFSRFRKGRSLEPAKELFAGFRDSGFVYLQNHDVPHEVVDEAFVWVRYAQFILH
jgi:isopenicillin N synthase-like dioxygenase